MSGMFERWMHNLVAAVQRRESKANVVVVNWLGLAHQLYPDAVNHTRQVGKSIATLLDWLQVRLHYTSHWVCLFLFVGVWENWQPWKLYLWPWTLGLCWCYSSFLSTADVLAKYKSFLFFLNVKSLPKTLWVFSWNNTYSCIVAGFLRPWSSFYTGKMQAV